MTHTKLTMAQALNQALRDAMTADDSVLMFGEDVGALGGVFRITDGLAAEFGDNRCFDTPLAESGIVGMAVGLAMNGMRPVVEMQFDAFGYPAFEQVVSHVAKMRNRTRGRITLPMVIRVPYAGGIGGVEHHCDSSESYYAHTPGLTVVAPATVADAYTLLRKAIEWPDPVIFLEPKRLYNGPFDGRYDQAVTTWAGSAAAEVPEGHYTVSLGSAAVVRDGEAATALPQMTKRAVADALWDRINTLRSQEDRPS